MSLDLDERQRAMLQEMKVPVWWPAKVPVVTHVEPSRPSGVASVAPSATPPHAAATTTSSRPVDTAPPANRVTQDPAVRRLIAQVTAKPVSAAAIGAMTWPELQQTVASCQDCQLCENRKSTVFGAGQPALDATLAPQVDWLVVGDAPDESEEDTGQPFAGPSGQLLDNMLKAMGLARHHNVFLLNVVKCRPPGNRNPSAAEIAQCQPYLSRQIELLQPKMILAVGRFGINAVLQASVPNVQQLPLGKLRGQVHFYDNAGVQVPVVATYHPTALLRNSAEKAKAWADLCMAMTLVKPAA